VFDCGVGYYFDLVDFGVVGNFVVVGYCVIYGKLFN